MFVYLKLNWSFISNFVYTTDTWEDAKEKLNIAETQSDVDEEISRMQEKRNFFANFESSIIFREFVNDGNIYFRW